MDIEAEIEKLYQIPLAEFVDARNQLASRLRRHDRAVAQKVKQLSKPSVSAWAVNQAYWTARREFDALLDSGDRLRDVQRRALGGEVHGGEVQAAMLAQRAALAAVLERAQQALEKDGHGMGKAVLRRVSTTLEALASHGRGPSAPEVGRLHADVPAPGFDALADLAVAAGTPGRAGTRPGLADADRAPGVPRSGRTSANDNLSSERPRTRQDRAADRAARARARRHMRAIVDEARAEASAHQRALRDAEQAEKAALDRVYAAEKTVTAAREQLERATALLDLAVDSAESAKRYCEQAKTVLAMAKERAAAAEEQLDGLESRGPFSGSS